MTYADDNTKSTAIDITIAGSSLTVIARAEHIPKTCIVIGLLSFNGSVINLLFFFEKSDSSFAISN